MHCVKFDRHWLIGSGEKGFLISSMYFRYFVIISPWKRAGPFIWTNLNPLYLRMLCAKFGWNWPSGSGEEDENVKSLQTDGQTDRRTDDGRQVIRKAHLSFQLRWAKKKQKKSDDIQRPRNLDNLKRTKGNESDIVRGGVWHLILSNKFCICVCEAVAVMLIL